MNRTNFDVKLEFFVANDDMDPIINYGFGQSPYGICLLAWLDEKICFLGFVDSSKGETLSDLKSRWKKVSFKEDALDAERRIESVFSKQANLHEIILIKGTDFQVKVWKELLNLPFGKVTTYEKLAQSIGQVSAVRAVANAVGANPISYIIPCHRVIRKSGVLGGYHWGLVIKKSMLLNEGYLKHENSREL